MFGPDYPEPRVKWYGNADDQGRGGANPSGLTVPAAPRTPTGATRAAAGAPRCEYAPPPPSGNVSMFTGAAMKHFQDAGHAASNQLTVCVNGLHGLKISDDGSRSRYRATAHYCDEPPEVAMPRSTPAQEARASQLGQSVEDCPLSGRIHMPYNSRQQFVIVDIFRVGGADTAEVLVGQATIPIADPSASTATPWPITCEHISNGAVTASLSLPGDEPDGSRGDEVAPSSAAGSTASSRSAAAASTRAAPLPPPPPHHGAAPAATTGRPHPQDDTTPRGGGGGGPPPPQPPPQQQQHEGRGRRQQHGADAAGQHGALRGLQPPPPLMGRSGGGGHHHGGGPPPPQHGVPPGVPLLPGGMPSAFPSSGLGWGVPGQMPSGVLQPQYHPAAAAAGARGYGGPPAHRPPQQGPFVFHA